MKAAKSSVLIAILTVITQFATAQTVKPKLPDSAQDTTKKGPLQKAGGATLQAMPTPAPSPSPTPTVKSSGASTPQKVTGDPSRNMTVSATPTPTSGKAPAIAAPLGPQKVPGTTSNSSANGVKTPAINKDTADQSLGKPKIVDGSKLSKEAFRALPGNAVIMLPGGQQTTKQAMLDETKAKMSKLQSGSSKTTPSLAGVRAKFEQKQQAELKARNDKVLAEIARYKGREQAFVQSQSYQTIQNEAVSLHGQYTKASPQEKQRIELRARELQRQLENLKATNLK